MKLNKKEIAYIRKNYREVVESASPKPRFNLHQMDIKLPDNSDILKMHGEPVFKVDSIDKKD